MSNTIISPYMNMPVPVPSQEPGPDWANDIVADLSIVDSHDHTPGRGVPLTPDSLNINADLPMNGYDLTGAGAVTFTSKVAALTSLLESLQVVGVDLYYIDGSGNSVRITQSGSVTGASGTITGLPSGTASASYSGGTFTWQSATNTPATMDMGPAIIRSTAASSKGVTLSAQTAQAANYNIFWPLVAPAVNQIPISDASGNLSWTYGQMPIGSVIATFPNLTGAYSTAATTTADAYGFVLCAGQTISDVTSPMNGQAVPNINNSVFLQGSAVAGSSGGAATSSGIGAHTHAFTSTTSVATDSHLHIMSHVHSWGASVTGSANYFYVRTSDDPSSTSITVADSLLFSITSFDRPNTGTSNTWIRAIQAPNDYYTTGVIDSFSGSGSTAKTAGPSAATTVSGTTNSSGTSFSILPPYISAVYLMRVK